MENIFTMENMFTIIHLEQIIRVVLSALCCAVVGFERKRRSKSAGIRTHMIVSLSSALMMLVSKYGFFDVMGLDGAGVDVSRLASGVVSAIGFLGVGVIFVRKQAVTGVTTAAGLWATVGIGLTIGSGMYTVGVATTLLLVLMQLFLHLRLPIFREQQSGTMRLHLADGVNYEDISRDLLEKKRIRIANFSVRRSDNGGHDVELLVNFPPEFSPEYSLALMEEFPCIRSIDS